MSIREKMSRTPDETLKRIDRNISQLKARKKSIENRERQKAKQEHTRQLIKYGELVEKYLKCQTPEELEEFLKRHDKS